MADANSAKLRIMLQGYEQQLLAARRLARFRVRMRLAHGDAPDDPDPAAHRHACVEKVARELYETLLFTGSDNPVVEDIRQQSDGSWLIAGGASVDDVAEELDIRDKEEIDAVAIGGLVQEKLSRLPKVGDHFVWGSFDGTVTRATNRRVQEVRLVSRPPEPETKKPDRRDRDKD